ncbi:collagenolytic serine protease [Penaeus vannamei]|uniref:Collagenolytic serine protease n=1 Tax=Penaeus vannamei TaxID=6689 RepID=A0A423SU61_PENVA|nr:collagenolytic serine protease [Penaeus vannamei]
MAPRLKAGTHPVPFSVVRMVIKVAALLLVCVAVASGLPHGGKPGQLRARTNSVPNRARAFQHLVLPQQPRRNISGTKRVEGCGVAPLAPSKESRLYGGRDAVPHEYPWNVVVWMDHAYWCGGVLISDEWVMTSGGCVQGSSFHLQLLSSSSPTSFFLSPIFFRQHPLLLPSQRPPFTSSLLVLYLLIFSLPIHQHPSSSLPPLPRPPFTSPSLLVPLSSSSSSSSSSFSTSSFHLLISSYYIQPVCLPSYSDAADSANFVDIFVTATGWGADTHGYHHALQYLDLKTISTQQCVDVYGSVITDIYLCTAGDRGVGGCNVRGLVLGGERLARRRSTSDVILVSLSHTVSGISWEKARGNLAFLS